MKTISFYLKCSFCIALGIFISTLPAVAQKAPATAIKQTVPVCSEVLPAVKKEAQAQADETCSTITTCTECMDKASKIKIKALQVIQPTCNDAATVDEAATETSVEYKKTRFNFEILQSPCTKKGTNLAVYVNNNSQTVGNRNFSYLWEVDGQKAGHEESLNCVCGSNVVVRVTDQNSGQSITKKVKLKGCNDSKD